MGCVDGGGVRDAPVLAGQLRALLAAPEPPGLEQEGRGCSHGWVCGCLTLQTALAEIRLAALALDRCLGCSVVALGRCL